MELVTNILAIGALGFCALLGLGSLFVPQWAAGVVRLSADPDPSRPGGFSEFRATYGGLLFMLHMTVLVVMLIPGEDLHLRFKIFALFPVAMAWIGAGFGRTVSLILDGAHNRSAGLIPVWIPLEIALGLAIASPVLQLAV